jgi:hypothetical protein
MESRIYKNYVWSNTIDKIMFRKNDDLQPSSAGKLTSLKDASSGITALGLEDEEVLGKQKGADPLAYLGPFLENKPLLYAANDVYLLEKVKKSGAHEKLDHQEVMIAGIKYVGSDRDWDQENPVHVHYLRSKIPECRRGRYG